MSPDSNALDTIDFKVVYRRYASLFFIAGIDLDNNELMALELIQRYVEVLDKWFMNVCELDIIFNFPQAYAILGAASSIFCSLCSPENSCNLQMNYLLQENCKNQVRGQF